jgi:hypothetical protein
MMVQSKPDVLKVQGVMARGYGIIPKLPMQDTNLTIEAKAIYAYIRSYAGAGTTAFPSRSKILHDLQIGENRYYKHFEILKKHGYITVEQHTDNRGRFRHNIYTLVENIPENQGIQDMDIVPYLQNEGTANASPYLHFPCTDNPRTENGGINNNNNKINILNNNSAICLKNNNTTIDTEVSSSLVLSLGGEKNRQNETRLDETTAHKKKVRADSPDQELDRSTQDHYKAYKSIIQENIDYADLVASTHGSGFIDNILGIMADIMITKSDKMVKIGNEFKPFSVVQAVIMKLTRDHIELVVEKYREQGRTISYKKAYLRSMLYNVYHELDAHYENQIRVDYQSANTENWLTARNTE